MPRRYSSEESKKRILSASVRLFLEKGYSNTTVAEILKAASVTSSTFQNIFKTKDGILLELIGFMFLNQFSMAKKIAENGLKPVYVYAAETSLQLTLAEINENLRDIYVEVYSHPETLSLIQRKTSNEIKGIFSEYISSDYKDSDIYEIEIGTSGMMRNYMAKKCDIYFTLEKKLEKYIDISLGAYNVPEAERKEIIGYVLSIDMRQIAKDVMQKLFESLAMKYEFRFNEKI